MTSRTSVCAPNPTARPTIPAPVSTGVMSTSSSRRIIERGDPDDQHRQCLLDHHAQGFRALCSLDDVETGADAHLALEASRRGRPESNHHVGGDCDDGDAQAIIEQPAPQRLGDAADFDGGPIADEPQRRQGKRRGSNQKGDEADDTLGPVDEQPLVLIRENRAEAALDDAGHEVPRPRMPR